MKGSVFKYYNCHFKGRPRPEPWRSWRDLILQRVPAVVTSPNGASPQSKHCKPPIPSHSRISQLVPPEYGGNLGRGKIGTQTGVIFAAPWCSEDESSRCWPREELRVSKSGVGPELGWVIILRANVRRTCCFCEKSAPNMKPSAHHAYSWTESVSQEW